MKDSADVVVLGGGPGGACAANLLAREGLDVLVLEKDTMPRFHIGESLITETWWTFEKLGILDALEKSSFPRKYSVQFINAAGRESRPFYFNRVNSHASAVTWQVERSVFDKIMIDSAQARGAFVEMGTTVKKVLFDGDRAVGVSTVNANGVARDISAKVVVDASGLGAILGRQLRLIEPDPKLRKAAIFAHYTGAYRDTGIDEGATLIINTDENDGWFWYIPLSDDRVSVGVVGSIDKLIKGRGRPTEILAEEIERHPTLRERIAPATQSSDVRVLNDFSYRARSISGNGWVLVGDAFGFIDPVYSTGIFLALKSADMAAEAILEGFRTNDFSARQLGKFGPEFADAMESMRKLVYAFYTPGFSFADFVRAHPEHGGRLIDLLTGNVFKEGINDIFTDMEEFCDLPDDRPLEPSPN